MTEEGADFDMPDQPQPGEDTELEAVYNDLREARSALAGLMGVMEFIISSTETSIMMRDVLAKNSHVRLACDVLKIDYPKSPERTS
jgi:hypothetical protein